MEPTNTPLPSSHSTDAGPAKSPGLWKRLATRIWAYFTDLPEDRKDPKKWGENGSVF